MVYQFNNNNFFVGSNLAKYICLPNGNISVLDYLQNTKQCSMFLEGVEENDTITIVRNC